MAKKAAKKTNQKRTQVAYTKADVRELSVFTPKLERP
jgi:hypothetical protein